MNSAATFRANFIPLSSLFSTSCCDLRFLPSISSAINCRRKCSSLRRSRMSRLVRRGKRGVVCRATETETEPESNDDKEKRVHEDGEMRTSTESNAPVADQVDDQSAVTEIHNSNSQINGNGTGTKAQDGNEDGGDTEVASGSPLPGVKPQQLDESARIPKETIEILRNQVFGFDTFFVINEEPYEGGVLFKGNLRGQAARSYEKITERMEEKFGDQYKLFLLTNPEDDKPVAVVVPRKTLQPETTAVPEWFAAGAFGLVTVFTLLLRNVPALQSNLLYVIQIRFLLSFCLPSLNEEKIMQQVQVFSAMLFERNK